MTPQQDDIGDWVCEHGIAVDVHCCNCHNGFLFDASSCVCAFDDPDDGVCPGCGGTDGACDCFDDDDADLLSDWPDCHMHNGSCGKAGSEECDWECPNSRLLK